MIICSCNNIRTQDVQEAKDNGYKDLKECCNYLNMDIQCATCLKQLREELEDE